ncbi:MAG: RNA methyltransferase, partial [Solobacterium sp.]|nr:RNA methyltransferase [Solobacterium sp.]
MERIDSTQNAKVKNWVRLHQKKGRDETGLFLIEGMHLTEEALKAGIVETVITDIEPASAFPHVIMTTSAVMRKLSQNPSGAHVIAVCRQLRKQAEGNSRILILDDIQDPGNLGTLIRTAVSFAFDAVYCSEKTCDLYN